MKRRLCLALTIALIALPVAAQQPEAPPAVGTDTARGGEAVPTAQAAPASQAQDLAPNDRSPSENGGSTLPIAVRMRRDLSPWSMFLAADILVKGVMIGLAFASLLTWTVLIAKNIELFLARRRMSGALARIETSPTLSEARLDLGAGRSVVASFVSAALTEIQMSAGGNSDGGIQERVASRLAEILRSEARAVRRGMGLLATIGATAPFVGLFGTVWGIMNSFIGISKSQTTNLAVVAPGIAEALLATAIGLVTAIPAVVIYNYFTRKTRSYLELVSVGAGTVQRSLSRDLDRASARNLARAE